ncbi:NT-type C2 domain [Sesbania bispinosa]|nr:NT-type C2 domain [Sesbania bispinosa]
MVLGIRSKSRKRISMQVHYIIHVQGIKPWPPSQSLKSAQSVLLKWENGDQNSGFLAPTAGDGKIEFNEPFRLSVLLWREASKKGKHRENFQKNCLEFHLYDKSVKSQLLGSATINLADFGIIKEAKSISIPLNYKRSFRNSVQPFLYVNIQPFDMEGSSSSPNSNLSKELSLDQEESDSASQSLRDDDIEIASFTDDDSDDIPSNTLQTVRSASETPGDSNKISEGGIKGSNKEFVPPLESSTSSSLGNTKDEASTKANGIESPSSSVVLSSDMRNAANERSSLPKISEESVKVADASSKIQESLQQSCEQNITKGDILKAISPDPYISSSMKPNFERDPQSKGIQEDNMTQEDSTEDQTYKKDCPDKVSRVSNTGVMEDNEKMDQRRKAQKQFTMRNKVLENELVNKFSDDDSRRKGKLNSDALLLSEESHEHPTGILTNDKAEDMKNVKFPLQPTESHGQFIRSQTLDQAEEINTFNDVHVGTASHEDINVNDSFLNDNTELKAEVEMLREELREAAALEVSMYSVIAEHGSSSNKVHAPARRLSRFYFQACRVGSPATIASAAQSAVSGFVLVSKACGNDVPRLTFWFSNLILLRAIVSKGVENIHIGDGPCINSECDSAAAKSSSSRKIYGRRYTGDQDQGTFSIDLWKRAFKDSCERLCPLRAGGHQCGCLPVIARLPGVFITLMFESYLEMLEVMVMEQLVNRLDVAMFNAILRESDEEMPTDPISDPISDSKVLPIPAGKSGFGAGAQLKNAIGDWSRWLSDLFGIDDSDSHEDNNENDDPKCESSFKPFPLLNALSDLMMLPLEMLADGSMRKEVCPRFGILLIKRVVNNFVPDEFSPGPVPDAVLEALYNEDIQDDEGSITSFPCTAGSTSYAPPPASSVVGMLQEVGTQYLLRSGSFVLKKLYTSDDELDELDSPLAALGMDDSSLASTKKLVVVKKGRKVVRYELLREVWKGSD